MKDGALRAVCALAGTLALGGGWLLGWVTDTGLRPPPACQGLFCSSITARSASPTPTPVRTTRPTTAPPRRTTIPAPTTSAPPPITTVPPVTTAPPSTAPPSITPTVEPTVTETSAPLPLPLIG